MLSDGPRSRRMGKLIATLPASAAAKEWVMFRCLREECGIPPAAHTFADVSFSDPLI